MTAALVLSVIANVALAAFLAAVLVDYTNEKRAFTDYRMETEQAERERVARRSRLGLPAAEDAGSAGAGGAT